ncbi:hypothetical protein EJP77_07740 [Paenibacillus zeisoli]|uniref:Uncharacterized protein n=1 Tax=Paenibacillus zeisoli TaxID=2496267 RepID=A0A433XHH8_9BACL|nr:hypothetical protein [Paenibacillus zeisoli]RUT33529.1 hypothetical protein EJP77_07740 [Paenibacillus zeisoli]
MRNSGNGGNGNKGSSGSGNGNGSNGNGSNGKKKNAPAKLSPQQIAVVVGLLTNVLEVNSILLDKDQNIEIVLTGSIRRKTKADRIAEELGDVSVADLLDAFVRKNT